MRIFSRSTLEEYWEKRPEYRDMKKLTISSPIVMKKNFPTCRTIGNHRVIFKILWNSHRMIVEVNYWEELLRIKFIGNHSEYDRINAKTVNFY